jgi:hypothetical protein
MTGASLTEEDQGQVEPYESGSGLAYSSLGGKRRTRGKKNSRKRSQRKSKKYMKKMYRGGDNGEVKEELQPKESEEQKENQDQESKQDGGRRRRKGKMNKGKTRKGKVSKWITHVKNFSRANKMDFRDALKDPKCKASYHKMK